MRWNGGARGSTTARRLLGSLVAVILGVAGVVTGGVVAGAPVSAAPTSWTISPSPSPNRPSGTLAGVSCPSPTNCFAAGGGGIERWNGTTWSKVTSAVTGDATLNAVSCASATSCIAVGSSSAAPFSEKWNGTTWSTTGGVTPGGATFISVNGVSCTSASNCSAVGSYSVGATSKTLIERWNGSSWKIVASPNPSGAITSFLMGVTCRSATSCFAVGGHVEAGDNKGGPLAERWNGTTWTVLPIATPKARATDALLTTARLNGVTCPSATSCTAVGYTASDALVERWNGSTWSRVATPALPAQNAIAELRAVSCASVTDCSAVGVTLLPVDQREGVERPNSVIEHWNGRAWSIQPRGPGVPVTMNHYGAGGLSELDGVSCPSTTSCAAVGNAAIAERWNGKAWSLAPIEATGSDSQLYAASCPGASSCFAVGTAAALLEARHNTLVERWDGNAWSIVPSPTPSGINVDAALKSISCVSPTNCFAVGSYNAVADAGLSSGFTAALIERWDGTRWSMVALPAPAPNTRHALLAAVSCTSATNCIAVGNYDTFSETAGGAYHLMSERWNGTSWSLVSVPSSTTSYSQLSGVACTSPTSCLAVGTSATFSTLAEHWDGSHWTVVTTPKLGGNPLAALNAVSCTSATDCTAVGNAQTSASPTQKPLIEHWNGTSWALVAAPAPIGASASNLAAVSCPSATDCTAVGFFVNDALAIPTQQLIEQWNGTSWSIVAVTVAADTGTTGLNGVTCTNVTACTAVGSRVTGDGGFTLAELGS